MAKILNIETATKVCSVALFDGEELIAVKETGGSYSHAENLHLFVEDVMQQAGMTLKELDAIAVSQGPGSYTGLRIGVSAAKGLCYALGKPLIAIDTLLAMANGMTDATREGRLLCPMIDARRMEVYCALYNDRLEVKQAVDAVVVDESTFISQLDQGRVLFFGDGAEKIKDLYGEHANAEFPENGEPSARFMGALAHHKFELQQFEDVAYFEPFYLKSFVATKAKKLI